MKETAFYGSTYNFLIGFAAINTNDIIDANGCLMKNYSIK